VVAEPSAQIIEPGLVGTRMRIDVHDATRAKRTRVAVNDGHDSSPSGRK
jgi:hypothetical protein